MKASLSVGVVLEDGALAVATSRRGGPGSQAAFPATSVGLQAIRIFLAHCDQPVRLAVTTVDMSLALSGADGGCETFIVSSAVPHHSRALARYAARAT